MPDRVFAATIANNVLVIRNALLAIVKASVEELVEEIKTPKSVGGNMPIDTSFLQNSLQGSTSAVPTINPEHDGSQPPMRDNQVQIIAMINNMEPGDTLHFGFTAVYALRQNYGFTGWDSLGRYYDQAGNLFVEKALQNWPLIVNKHAARLNARIAFEDET